MGAFQLSGSQSPLGWGGVSNPCLFQALQYEHTALRTRRTADQEVVPMGDPSPTDPISSYKGKGPRAH